jgi:predicted nucleotidyltransferase
MKFKNVAELHNKTTEILKYVKQEGYVIITNHGKPEAIIRKFSEDDIEDLVINNNVIKTMPPENEFLISEEKGSAKTQATRKKIINILKNSNASLIKVFGSFARGDFDSNSDIDLIVNFSDRKSLIDLARIELVIK